jgi:hypothetical protein
MSANETIQHRVTFSSHLATLAMGSGNPDDKELVTCDGQNNLYLNVCSFEYLLGQM